MLHHLDKSHDLQAYSTQRNSLLWCFLYSQHAYTLYTSGHVLINYTDTATDKSGFLKIKNGLQENFSALIIHPSFILLFGIQPF